MAPGYYWVRVSKANHKWMIAILRDGNWSSGDETISPDRILEIGAKVVGPPV